LNASLRSFAALDRKSPPASTPQAGCPPGDPSQAVLTRPAADAGSLAALPASKQRKYACGDLTDFPHSLSAPAASPPMHDLLLRPSTNWPPTGSEVNAPRDEFSRTGGAGRAHILAPAAKFGGRWRSFEDGSICSGRLFPRQCGLVAFIRTSPAFFQTLASNQRLTKAGWLGAPGNCG